MRDVNQPKLYLFIGYPGAGKTTVSKIISEATGAAHLWADVERHKLFPEPKHTREESDELYTKLNSAADYLLEQGKSVVFDTNFNHLKDRQKLRAIADKHNAETIIIWITTPVDIARKRAVETHKVRNHYDMSMSAQQFDAIVAKLEPPTENENVIKIDHKDVNKDYVLKKLGINT